MNAISKEESLFNFHSRVLFKGTPLNINNAHSVEELSEFSLFNQIFLSNMDEFCTKYQYDKILGRYANGMETMNKNIGAVVKEFEERFKMKFDRYFDQDILDEIFVDMMDFIELGKHELVKFKNGDIYTAVVDEYNHWSLFNVSDSIMMKLPIGYTLDGLTHIFDTNEYILHLCRKYFSPNVILFKTSTSYDNSSKIEKIEYYGKESNVIKLQERFKIDGVLIKNNYILNKYISAILNSPFVESEDNGEIRELHPELCDELLEYPIDKYESFYNVLDKASKDQNVESIRICVYRISKKHRLMDIIDNAVSNGIKVVVNVETNASYEFRNSDIVKLCQEKGATVLRYSDSTNLKVHSKLILIKYKDGRYLSNIATGNYNSDTASQYTDLSLFTMDQSIGKQVEDIFNFMEFGQYPALNDDLLVTQFNAKKRLKYFINREGRKGSEGLIVIKCNSLNDPGIIRDLEKAANNGCIVKLIVRGICTITNICENIEARSYVWDKLEHSRVYMFGKYNPDIYLGSLDLLKNKIDGRIEALVRVKDLLIKYRLLDYLTDYVYGEDPYILCNDGIYRKKSEIYEIQCAEVNLV